MCFNYVVVPIDRNLPINEILNILHESDATAVIYSEAFEPVFERAPRIAPGNLRHYINMDAPGSSGETSSRWWSSFRKAPGATPERLPKMNPEEMAEIIFTSGSLGRAKGVMLSQRNLAVQPDGDDEVHRDHARKTGFSWCCRSTTRMPAPAAFSARCIRELGAFRAVAEDRRGGPPAACMRRSSSASP